MRTIILGLLGATMLSSVAQAACNDIPNPTRFNPTELSAYQECWLDEYKMDQTAGILGSLAWVRLDGQYFSASLSAIRSMKGSDYADKFISAIENDLLEEVRSDAEERMMEITTIIIDGGEYSDEEYLMLKELREADSIEHAKAIVTLTQAHEIARNSAYGAGKAAMKAKLDAYYTEIIGRKDYTISQLEQVVANRDKSINYLKDRIKDIKNAVGFPEEGPFWATDDSIGLIQHLKDINWKASKYQGLVDQIDDLQTQVAGVPNMSMAIDTNEVSNVDGEITHQLAISNAEIGDQVRINGVFTEGSSLGYIDYVRVDDADDYFNVAGVVENNNYLDFIVIEEAADYYVDLTQVQTLIDLGDVDDAIRAAVTEAYDDGYEDGYRDGYNDGYADGVADRSPQSFN